MIMSESIAAALPSGTVLNKRFYLEAGAKRGGFGIVYSANDRKLGRKVAIKEYAPQGLAIRHDLRLEPLDRREGTIAAFREGLDRFVAEGTALASIRHSNVVQVYDHFDTNGTAYLVMEWVEGQPLRSLIADRARWSNEAAVMSILDPLLGALAAVHARGWVHRDIKPENLLIRGEDDQPVLLDFGIARPTDATHFTAMMTHGYAPPEQYEKDGDQGAWTDGYALAGVGYCLMTGRDPIAAPARMAAAYKGKPDPLPTIEQLVTTRPLPYSRALIEIVAAGLALNERQRPQDVAAWRQRLPSAEARRNSQKPEPLSPRTFVVGPDTSLPRIAAASRSPVEIITGAWPRPGCVFRDRTLDGVAGADFPEMVVLPPGTFTMGAQAGEEEREDVPASYRGRAEPCHKVTIARPFALGRGPVTRGQFEAFLTANPSYRMTGGAYIWNGSEWKNDPTADWRSPGFAQKDDHPVVCVNWQDAQAYVQWLSRVTGQSYRLPSEAEWEYACRAGTAMARYWGDRQPTDREANFGSHIGGTTAIGSYPANGFGLYDMLGNVWEWVEDRWHNNYQGAPNDGAAWTTGDCTPRVLRGGSWYDVPRGVRAAIRSGSTPDDRNNVIGFRVTRTLTP